MQSMTGFARASTTLGDTDYSLEIKSVNHRYLDTRFRIPSFLSSLEIPMGKIIRQRFQRGSFDIWLRYKWSGQQEKVKFGTRYILDEKAAESLTQGFKTLNEKFKVSFPPPPEVYLQAPKIFLPVEESLLVDELEKPLSELLGVALAQLELMREKEGESIEQLIHKGLSQVTDIIEAIKPLARLQPERVKKNLLERLEKLQLKTPLDAQKVEWEVAFFADKSDFTEEIDRLESHIKEFGVLAKEKSKAHGRKLDFLTQEVNRELNTLGSKATLLEITQYVVEAKSIIEKLRQQIQNVE